MSTPSGAARISVRGNNLGRSASWGVRRVELPDAGEFSKIFKRFLKKIAKMHYFSRFFNKFNNRELIFRAFGEKHKVLGNFEKPLKTFKEFFKEIKINLFYHIFQKM